MAENNQFFLAVTATVALVSIVALVILVLNAASPRTSYYVEPIIESAADIENIAGNAPKGPYNQDWSSYTDSSGSCGTEGQACGGTVTRKCCKGYSCDGSQCIPL